MDHKDIGYGRVRLEKPCEVPWLGMKPVEGGNRYCQHCSKVVHNITGLSPAEIVALLQSDPGNVCVNFVQFHLPPDTERKQPKAITRPIRRKNIRYAAAATAMLLLTQQGQSSPPHKPRTEHGPWAPQPQDSHLPGNTLVSGNVMTLLGDLIPHDVEVVIYRDHRELARVMTRAGLFFVNLDGLAEPTDTITISIQPGPQPASDFPQRVEEPLCEETNEDEDPVTVLNPNLLTTFVNPTVITAITNGYSLNHQGILLEVLLQNAQNMELKLDWEYNYFPYVYLGGAPPIYFDEFLVHPLTCFVTISEIPPTDGPSNSQDYSCTDMGRP